MQHCKLAWQRRKTNVCSVLDHPGELNLACNRLRRVVLAEEAGEGVEERGVILYVQTYAAVLYNYEAMWNTLCG